MIDVAQYRTELAALPGTHITIPRDQIDELLREAETGQAARRTLSRIKTIAVLSSTTAGVRA